MALIFVLLGTVLADTIEYLSFSSDSNPSEETLSFDFNYSLFDTNRVSYTIEFWMRPTGRFSSTVMSVSSDWLLEWEQSQSSLSLRQQSSSDSFCDFSGVFVDFWVHIAFAKSLSTLTFTCYKDARTDQVSEFSLSSTVDTYPNIVSLGGDFIGNISELRFWRDAVRTQAEIEDAYERFFDSPFPDKLHTYWRMVNPTDTSVIEEEISNRDVDIPNDWDLDTLWVSEETRPLVCPLNGFFEAVSCGICPSICLRCSGAELELCEQTVNFLDIGRNPFTLSWVPKQTSYGTVEFWMMINEWTLADSTVIQFDPLLTIKRKDETNLAVFIDASGTEKFEYLFPIKTWIHIAFVLQDGLGLIYIDGNAAYEGEWTSSEIDTVFLCVSETDFFNGLFRELRFWDTPLSQAEIVANMMIELTSPFSSSLVELWPLNEGEGFRLNDIVSLLSTSINQDLDTMWRPLDCTSEDCLVLCPTKTFLNENSSCQECDITCQTCDGPSENDCLSCSDDFPFQIDGQSACYEVCPEDYKQFLFSCVLSCPSSTYEDNGICESCDSSCKTCSGPAPEDCNSCADDYFFRNSLCIFRCPTGNYPIEEECFACDPSCFECDGPGSTECYQCLQSVLFEGQCLSECPLSTYQSGQECFDCAANCAECSGPNFSDCSACQSSAPFQLSTGECVASCPNFSLGSFCVDACPSSYFNSNGVCLECDTSCQECLGPSDKECTECIDFLYQGSCYPECLEGTYEGDDQICLICNSVCKECEGPDETDCTLCNDAFPYLQDTRCVSACDPGFLIFEFQCVAECPQGFYETGIVCGECNDNCFECSGSATNCLSCPEGLFLYQGSCLTECLPGFYPESFECTSCSNECLECDGGTNTDCTACSEAYLFLDTRSGQCVNECDGFTFEQFCYAQCPTGLYPGSSSECLECDEKCSSCIDAVQCLSCNDGFFLYEFACLETCPDGFYGDNNLCVLCDSECAICSGSGLENCSLCKTGLLYITDEQALCLQDCPDDSYVDGTNCALCSANQCEKCQSAELCTLCEQGSFMSNLNPGKCVSQCEAAEIPDLSSRMCVQFSERFPEGEVARNKLTIIQIKYPLDIKLGTGELQLFSKTTGNLRGYSRLQVNAGTLSISVNPNDFEVGFEYYVIIPQGFLVANGDSPNEAFIESSWEFRVIQDTIEPLTVTINNGTKGIEVQRSSAFELEARSNYDSVDFLWECFDYSTSYRDYKSRSGISWANYVETLTETSTSVCPDWVSLTNTTVFTLTEIAIDSVYMYRASVDSVAAELLVKILPSQTEPLRFKQTPEFKLNIDKPFQLESLTEELLDGYSWTCKGDCPTLLTPSIGTFLLTIPENTLLSSDTYTISLTYSSIDSKTSVSIDLSVNSPPSNCVLFMAQEVGTALITDFDGELLGCVDEDLPLKYYFAYALDEYTVPDFNDIQDGILPKEYQLTSFLDSPSFSSKFSRGTKTVIGYAYDALGSRSSATFEIEVLSQNNFVNLAETLFFFPESIETEEDIYESMALSGALALELSEFSDNIEGVLDIKEQIIAILQEGMAITQTFEGISKAKLLYAMYTCIETVLRQPVNTSIVEEALELINSIDPLDLKVKDFPYQDKERTDLLFNTKDLYNLVYFTSQIINNVLDYVSSEEINGLFDISQTVLSLNSQLTEDSKKFATDGLSVTSKQDFLGNFNNTEYVLDSSTSVTFPGFEENLKTELQISKIDSNIFNSSTVTIDKVVGIRLVDTETSAEIAVTDSESPFLFRYTVSQSQIKMIKENLQQESSASVWPECKFWNTTENQWSGSGCSVFNIAEVYAEFQKELPGNTDIVCACRHLTQFTVTFVPSISLNEQSFILNSSNSSAFYFFDWENVIVLAIIASLLLIYVIAVIAAFVWDKNNPGLSSPSFEASMSFAYNDPRKVDEVIQQLSKEYFSLINTKANESDTKVLITKMIASGTFYRLFHNNENHEFVQEEMSPRIIEDFLEYEEPYSDESWDEPIESRIRNYLNEGVPRRAIVRHLDPTPEEVQGTVRNLKEYVRDLESDSHKNSSLEDFIDRNDTKVHPFYTRKFKLHNATLKKEDLKSLGYDLKDFYALRADRYNNLAVDTQALTGGNFCNFYLAKKLVSNVRRFYYAIRLKYWYIFCVFIKKDHKFVSLFLNFHIEFTKAQMVSLFFAFCVIQLFVCQVYVTFFNWEFAETYTDSDNCAWGCNHEAQIIAGIVCAMIPWPFIQALKYLLARNISKMSWSTEMKSQALLNKRCRESTGFTLGAIFVIGAICGTALLSYFNAFNSDEAEDFLYCYWASLLWSLIIGELIATFIKSLLVWMASEINREPGEDNLTPQASWSRKLLAVFPCLLPTEV